MEKVLDNAFAKAENDNVSQWNEEKLGDLIEIKYGKDHKKLNNGNIPCFGSGGIMRYVDTQLYDEESILIPRKGSLNNIMYQNNPFWTVDTMFWSKIDKTKVFPKFLFYQLTLIDYTILNVGSAVPSLTVSVLNDIDVTLPPLPEQKAIATVLSSLDTKIDLLHRQNKTLEELAKTLFRQWFYENIEDCKFEKLGNYVNTIDNRGKTPPNKPEKTNFPLIEVNALKDETRLVDYSVIRKYVDEEIFEGWFRAHPKKYDTLFSTVGSIAEVSMFLLEIGSIAQNVVAFSPINGMSPFYLYEVLCFYQRDIKEFDIGSVQPSIKVSHLMDYEIPIPIDLTKIEKFDQIILGNCNKMELNYKEIKNLEKLRDTLLPKLMSGEVRVKQ
ncbi:MAG: restriction endonuclease subunit S [Flavobacteriaceae bacterium]|nr:restriction endonuclease subunit S [Flavobacteriaceae bacterium]|tara:strand:+ start:3308 stop:4459 length:1152 start_codon:yes stop_codon:yes gene_type:complete